jgi:fatty acid synthase subunit alpha, fungi type
LGAIGNVLSIENMVDVTFYRGMTMQVAVPRDAQGRSNYGMCAVNPSRVSHQFGEDGLKLVVSSICRKTNCLLEIVNYNVEGFQYVVAGDLSGLDVLRLVLNKIAKSKPDFKVEAMLENTVRQSFEVSNATKISSDGGFLKPERGIATIPLPGIDVPFHSSFLSNGISTFRTVLQSCIQPRSVRFEALANKYIPNLTAMPFEISKKYFQCVQQLTNSSIVTDILSRWEQLDLHDASIQQKLSFDLLVELLAHQFAMPVRWIETQELLFQQCKVEKLIEIGPSAVLVGMAQRTLKLKHTGIDDALAQKRVQLNSYKDLDAICYVFENPAPLEAKSTDITAVPTPVEQIMPQIVMETSRVEPME